MDCGHQCHEVGGPWIAEDPSCPIHGINGIGEDLDRIDDMREVIRELCQTLGQLAHDKDHEAHALIERARGLL